MFFSGDPSARKRVDLGGRSSKERDRKVLLEQTREERRRRQGLRLHNSSATKIQKFFRGKKALELARSEIRKNFCSTFGEHCERIDWNSFGTNSDFLRQLLFFFNANEDNDIAILCKVCNLLLQYVKRGGDIVTLFAGVNDSSLQPLVAHRVKKLTLICVQAVYQKRHDWGSQLLTAPGSTSVPSVSLLETVACLINPKLPWNCKVVGYLQWRKIYCLFRGIIISVPQNARNMEHLDSASALEQVLMLVASHVGHHPCCPIVDPRWSFSSQLLSIPSLWHRLPYLKMVFSVNGLGKYYFHQIACFLPSLADVLPNDISANHPGYACVLANILEAATWILSDAKFTSDTVADIIAVSTSLLDALPTILPPTERVDDDDDMPMDVDVKNGLDIDLERQITAAIDSKLLEHLVNALFRGTLSTNHSYLTGPSDAEVEAIGSICAFLHVTFNTFPLERIMTVLAYRTEIVPALWSFIKRCHDNRRWPYFSKFVSSLPADAPGWLLPVSVFCPIYKHMLKIIDNGEFYEQEKPLSLKDLKSLVLILKQALWQLLWVIPPTSTQKVLPNPSGLKKLSVENVKTRARVGLSELLTQLQDWNNRLPFTSASDFYSQDATSENFVSQAILGNTRASEIIKLAPFLAPFTSRVKIFTSQLVNSRQSTTSHSALTRHRFKIRRSRLLEDAFDQLRLLSEEDIKGPIRVAFINEHGEEEAGIDGGGIFKDFMENITRAAFDVQYGLFKETTDHLLYPNPGSGLVHEQHLQYFNFLGSLLGKAMYEGVLVDLPFATFFLSKLKQKYNFLNDLPSLDPELYRHLLFLKHYNGDISKLELYFVIVNNEYGEQCEEELLPGGRDMRVTNDNVITFIHLVANHRLNYQIRAQSTHFLRGFQQLIPKDWIDMFNEHEIQVLISGSLESLDIDDLRSNTNYSAGYHPDHELIEMFWEVLKSFSLDNQKKFLKFVTGCSRGPLLGFQYLEPKFCIQRAGVPGMEGHADRLPTSATCMNLLKLPPYKTKEQLQTKLLYAINSEAGFDLS
ncbi:E3 ubiquitin-protein ligase UPL6-like isoform X2 [Phragmites australis]|uniref:E3 ubiquitin-protein ligase UPL6-like isoform X2 n=1 Tax=Phragmites australis TaxID=29695 RepID=UPI002D76783A|nr:E3 ubiquitin-protein ligase UPL6-like isoform X2 [Phragmites australis]